MLERKVNENCEHRRLTKILGGPDYTCNDCRKFFRVTPK